MGNEERLQKILSTAGIASRRQAEVWIQAGRVTVNGQVVTVLGAKADAARDHIKVDGKLIHPQSHKTYILLNKPKGVLSTAADPLGRIKVTDLVRNRGKLFPVGRLDCNTEGIILLTNDGEFAKIVSDAGEIFPKVYEVKVRGTPEESDLNRLRAGARLPDGVQLAPCKIQVLSAGKHSWIKVTLTQGKNREIRKMFDAIRHSVVKLRRTHIGFLTDKHLPVGASRPLTPAEVSHVFDLGRRKPRQKQGPGSRKDMRRKPQTDAQLQK